MAILTVNESADMLNRLANEVIAGGHAVTLYPSYAQLLLNVLAALEVVTAERDALAARVAAMEPDWTEAPEWAQWWAIDEDGSAYWYVAKPEPACACWATDRKCEYILHTPIAWRSSLRQRPVTEVTP